MRKSHRPRRFGARSRPRRRPGFGHPDHRQWQEHLDRMHNAGSNSADLRDFRAQAPDQGSQVSIRRPPPSTARGR